MLDLSSSTSKNDPASTSASERRGKQKASKPPASPQKHLKLQKASAGSPLAPSGRPDQAVKARKRSSLSSAAKQPPGEAGAPQEDRSTGIVSKQGPKRDDLDDLENLFAGVQKAKAASPKLAEIQKAKGNSRKAEKRKLEGNKDSLFGEESRKNRRRTEEGYAIYSEEELRVNKGGGTADCPFDCQCCF